MTSPSKTGPTRVDMKTARPKTGSPGARQAAREASEAAALAEIEAAARKRREKSARLRKLRLAEEKSEA